MHTHTLTLTYTYAYNTFAGMQTNLQACILSWIHTNTYINTHTNQPKEGESRRMGWKHMHRQPLWQIYYTFLPQTCIHVHTYIIALWNTCPIVRSLHKATYNQDYIAVEVHGFGFI